jgi:NAD(P)-dependent dehydrogenase (short-subunit alcohol dehydrogenase family)
MSRLADKVVLVAGGAGGIGLRCATRMRAEGAKTVVVADLAAPRDTQDLEYAELDVTDAAACERATADVTARYGRIDALVVASGINYATYARMHGLSFDRGKRPPVIEMDDSTWTEILSVNLFGTMYLSRAVGRSMAAAGSGSIVTVTSIAAARASVGNAPYCVSKAGIWMLTKCLALELAPYGVRVNAIAPGLIDTPMTADLAPGDAATAAAVAAIPLGRKGMPDDISAAAAYLASPDSSFLTGSVLTVDGGEGAAFR